jgi:hypothetical protein
MEGHYLVHAKPELHPGCQAVFGILSKPLVDIFAPPMRLTLIATQYFFYSESAIPFFAVSQEYRLEPAADKLCQKFRRSSERRACGED